MTDPVPGRPRLRRLPLPDLSWLLLVDRMPGDITSTAELDRTTAVLKEFGDKAGATATLVCSWDVDLDSWS